MKKIFIFFTITLALTFIGCEDLGDMNVDPTKAIPQTFNPNYFLSSSQWEYVDGTMGYNGPMLFQSGWVQILASTSSGGANYYTNMDKYVASGNTNDYQGRSWNRCYRSGALANEAIVNTESNPDLINLTSIAKIMMVLNLQYITDMYGDAPYEEAWMSQANVTKPVYDSQDQLYLTLLKDLEAAIDALDESKTKPTADLIYGGDIGKWRKFGYSLMLRLAMRLTKADAATAKTYAEKAAAGGTFASSADDAYVLADEKNGYRNDYARDLITPADFYQVRWSERMIDYLQNNEDPRLAIVAEVPQAGLAANQDVELDGISDPDAQVGLPNGYDLNGGATDISESPDYPGGTGEGDDFTPIGKYSRPNMTIYANLSGPVFIFTYAQAELLLAEAAVRGFSVGGTASAHYQNAVKGALMALAPYGATAVISEATAAAYAADYTLDSSSTEASLEMINEQYWATSGTLMNFTEAWNNWKRSGYPVLTPVVYPGNFSGGVIPRRQPYPTTESTLNSDSYSSAVSKISGGDTWSSRVWWDK